jgi:hypothetical protein
VVEGKEVGCKEGRGFGRDLLLKYPKAELGRRSSLGKLRQLTIRLRSCTPCLPSQTCESKEERGREEWEWDKVGLAKGRWPSCERKSKLSKLKGKAVDVRCIKWTFDKAMK